MIHILVGRMSHPNVHCAARESKYIKNIYHKCCNGTLHRGTVANSCISLCFVLPKSCLSYLKALMTTLALISKIWGDLGIYLYHIWEEWLRKLFGIMLVMLPESLYSYNAWSRKDSNWQIIFKMAGERMSGRVLFNLRILWVTIMLLIDYWYWSFGYDQPFSF